MDWFKIGTWKEMRIAFWKKKPKAHKPDRPMFSYRPGMALDYFRSQDYLVQYAKQLLRTPEFQQMLSVLHHELPLTGTIEGVVAHKRALRIIEFMATMPDSPVDEVQPTYGAESEFPELLNVDLET